MLKKSLQQASSIVFLVAISGFYNELQTSASTSTGSVFQEEEKAELLSIGRMSSFEETYVIFGNILFLHPKCHALEVKIFVEVANEVWEKSLTVAFYAFQVPVNLFRGHVGLVSIDAYKDGQYISNLWRHFFMIHGYGASRVDAEIDMHASICTYIEEEEANAESSVDEAQAIKKSVKLVPVPSYNQFIAKYMVCPKEALPEICSMEMLEGNFIELEPKHHYTVPGHHEIFMEQYPTAIIEPLGDSVIKYPPSRLIFGCWQIETWHLVSLVISMMVVQSLSYLLESFLQIENTTETKNVEHADTKHYNCVASWQLHFGCPSQGRSLKGNPPQNRGKSNLLTSGKGCYQEAWVEAEYHLGQVINSYAEGACFYYNCSSQLKDTEVRKRWGWNRDSVGRLTRV